MVHEIAFGKSRRGYCPSCGVTLIVAKGEMLCILCERPLNPIEPNTLGAIEGAETQEELKVWMELLDLSLKKKEE
jgi:uncharacterized Zn finger protein (UPF0148 family)